MPKFEPGHEKKGGRSKGSLNKSNRELKEIAEELGVNPFEVLLNFAKRDYEALKMPEFNEKTTKDGTKILEPSISPETQMNAAGKACEYLFPKLKAVEHTGLNGADLFANLVGRINGESGRSGSISEGEGEAE